MTRRDLRPGLQAAQVAHAAFTFSYEHRALTTQWLEESNWLVILSVADESELERLGDEAHDRYLPVTWFHEPDLDGQLTAIAIAPHPHTEALLSSLPLALKEFNGFSTAQPSLAGGGVET